MKSKETKKCNNFRLCIVEKIKEWAEYLFYLFNRRKKWQSNLCECYCIYRNYEAAPVVQDFLNDRKKNIERNGYKMTTRILPEESNDEVIGRVLLLRKNHIIEQATLKRKSDTDNQLIYWSFDNIQE